jgi:hypothetical protein
MLGEATVICSGCYKNLAMQLWRNNIHETLRWENVEWIHMAQCRVLCEQCEPMTCVHKVERERNLLGA